MFPIALNFRRSKFSQIAIFEDFVEIIANSARAHCMPRVKKFPLKYFREWLKIHEIKGPQKFIAIWYLKVGSSNASLFL